MIDRETTDRIYAAANIVEIIGEYVTLKRKGVNYTACCPFHNEKTPSFVVSPSKGLYKCFGCGKGGNAVTFIMEHENVSYPEALKMVAKRYGIEVQEKELTEEDIRACMHRTRQRFEGEDYKENTDSEAYKKYHRQLTGIFKQIAAVLGADKPSALTAEMRAAFIAECDALIIDEKGFIAPPQHRTK